MKKLMIGLVGAAMICGCGTKDNAIKMITEAAFPPYEFLRGQDIVGIDVEICRAVAQHMGREFMAETVDFDSVIPAVISGKADLAAAGITVTEDRKKNVDFSIPYVKTGIVVISKKSNPFKDVAQLKGRKIGVQSGTTSETYVLEQLKQEPERSRSPAEACAALKSGRVDFVIADIDPAKNCVKASRTSRSPTSSRPRSTRSRSARASRSCSPRSTRRSPSSRRTASSRSGSPTTRPSPTS